MTTEQVFGFVLLILGWVLVGLGILVCVEGYKYFYK